ncbi:GNAT family N-acetyltransferase [Streptomyces sp. NRRL S-118]|uniref:GNAT family N-acetyltransferase n=1 Tax=Streptomyces sp. NRRL S-118 TaxID=1463881 RepID=UPI00131D592C|nr:GNAT family protein [Streptomyces sp. NRRL S-118]
MSEVPGMGSGVPFRPFQDSELAMLDRALNDPEVMGQYAWTGWSGHTSTLRQQWEANRLLSPEISMLAVVREDTAVGAVTWRPVAYNGVSQCWNVGAYLLPEARGRGVMSKAGRALVDYLFAHTQAHRIEAHVEAGNKAARLCAEQAGMVYEGTARGAVWRGGGWRDIEVLAVVRGDAAPALVAD